MSTLLNQLADDLRPEPRALYEIAEDIRRHWPKVNYAAVPYLEAMGGLLSIDDSFYLDSAKGIVLRFLSNAGSWRGEHARRIKAELKSMAGVK